MLAADQIVSAIAGRISGQTAAGTRVASDRIWPYSDDQLPAWRVSAGGESIPATWLDGLTVEDDIEINVASRVRATSGLDQAMNALVAAALPVIFAAPVPYALELTGISRETDSTGEAALGEITIHLRAHVAFKVNAPEILISTP